MPVLSFESFIFDPRPEYPLITTANRYWNNTCTPSGLTFIFAHGTGFHKEQWEATVEDLFEVANKCGLEIREMWALDAPNHGDAALINEDVLQWGYDPVFHWEEYSRSIHSFLSGKGTGIDTDFSARALVAVGHSMGAVSLLLAQTFWPKIKFEVLIGVEMMMMAKQFESNAAEMLTSGSSNRRDIWASSEEMYKALKARPSWKVWDDRVLRSFVKYGIRPLPTATYPAQTEGVTLKCTRVQETACYRDPVGPSRAYRLLNAASKWSRLHLIYGAIDDYVPAFVKDDVINNASGGRENLASVRRVPNAGHLVPQVNPKGLAIEICDLLREHFQRSKL